MSFCASLLELLLSVSDEVFHVSRLLTDLGTVADGIYAGFRSLTAFVQFIAALYLVGFHTFYLGTSEGGDRYFEFDFVKSGRNGAPDVHLKCRITATKRAKPTDVPPHACVQDRSVKCDDQRASFLGSLLKNCVADALGTAHLVYQLLVCLSTKFAEIQQEEEWANDLLEEIPQQDSAKLKVLNWADATPETVNEVVSPRIEVSQDADFEADDEREEDDEEDESSGFFSDDLSLYSETDNEATSTADKVVQCNLGRFTVAQVKEAPSRLRASKGQPLVSHRELPAWLQNNEYLVRSHRPPLYSYRSCLRSVFSIHSETGNIWTHILGALGFAIFGAYFFASPVINLDWAGSAAFGLYFIGAITCLGLSATYHTLNCHSSHVCDLFCKVDYCGITILILGSFYPWLYFQFLCEPLNRLFYGLLVTVMGVITMKLSMSKKFGEPRYRALRASVFFGFAMVCGIIPTTHYGILHGWNDLMYETSFVYVILMVLMYVIGSCVYASRVPERFLPGRFDVAFHSHQIFHVFVVLGALTHYYGIYRLATMRMSRGPCAAGSTDSVLEALGVL